MLSGCFKHKIPNKQVDKAVQFHDPLKRLKLKTLASDDVIKRRYCQDNFPAYLLCQVIYVTSFNKCSDLRS